MTSQFVGIKRRSRALLWELIMWCTIPFNGRFGKEKLANAILVRITRLCQQRVCFYRTCNTIWCLVLLDRIALPLQTRSAGVLPPNPNDVTEYWYPTIEIAQQERNLCLSLFLRHTAHCSRNRIDFLVGCATSASGECARRGPSYC